MHSKTKLALATLAVSAVGLGALAGSAFADRGWGGHRGGGMMREFMERYDADKDGKVNQQDIDGNRTEWHGKYDADKNGSLNLKEFEALWLEAKRQEMIREFQRLDPNGDAGVTLDEYKEPLSRFVADRDRNGDGFVSREDRRHGGKHRWRKDRDEKDDNEQ